jgi:hypothetical protein
MGRKHEETKELVYRAIDELKRGNASDALAILERTVRPKWWSAAGCEQQYLTATNRISIFHTRAS